MRASGASLNLLRALLSELNLELGAIELFAADLGPGSFTGVKVGVTLAKTLAFSCDRQAAGIQSFDLIDPSGVVVIPSKRGEFFVRWPRVGLERSTDLPGGAYSGYGPGVEPTTYPRAEGFARVLDRLRPMAAELLVPEYLIEPSISTPKKPFLKA